MHCAQYDSPLGLLCLRSNGTALTSLQFGAAEEQGDSDAFAAVFRWLDAYFRGEVLPLPHLAPEGTPFQQKVWQQCTAIPYGCTCTYGELARFVDQPGAARAVGSALAHNPLLIMVPCHRVLPATGGIGRYAAGIARKQGLLVLENIDISTFPV